MIAVLAGGTGGAKLARGMLDVVGPEGLVVIANTGDDAEVYGVHVSPDPDLITYWLADLIDEEQGYGIRGDTWEVMAALAAAGRPTWFRLGDRDLAMCLVRTEGLRSGLRLTQAHAEVVTGLGVRTQVLPVSDDPVRTHIRARGDWVPFQEFMILEAGAVEGSDATIEGIELRGIEEARPTQEVLAAIESAKAIVIGPSNPVVSIWPILDVPGVRDAIHAARAPVVAVSPFVGGRSLKGVTEPCFAYEGLPLGAAGVVRAYDGLLDGLVADEAVEGIPLFTTDTLMSTPASRRQVAEITVEFAASLA